MSASQTNSNYECTYNKASVGTGLPDSPTENLTSTGKFSAMQYLTDENDYGTSSSKIVLGRRDAGPYARFAIPVVGAAISRPCTLAASAGTMFFGNGPYGRQARTEVCVKAGG